MSLCLEILVMRIFAAFSALAIAACFVAISWERAYPHDVGCDGKPPPEHIKSSCCGKADAFQVNPAMVRELPDGSWDVELPDAVVHLAAEKAEPSPDACYWIFYNKDIAAQYRTIYCFLVPESM